ncbi:MAG TPA: hypothetical protein PLS03_17310 [Terrimicrobiaceae bacterium]|nr:hypothetical protein [Terrimicrobiaceae bacterium]
MKKSLLVLASFLAVLLSGCDSPQKTADALRKEIVDFQSAPSETKQTHIEENFAKLETQIAKMPPDAEATAVMKEQLDDLRSDYQAAKMAKALQDAKNAIQGFGEALKDNAKGLQDMFRSSGTGK